MARLELNTPAPDFSLNDFRGDPFRLSDWQQKRHVILVLNRGFG